MRVEGRRDMKNGEHVICVVFTREDQAMGDPVLVSPVEGDAASVVLLKLAALAELIEQTRGQFTGDRSSGPLESP